MQNRFLKKLMLSSVCYLGLSALAVLPAHAETILPLDKHTNLDLALPDTATVNVASYSELVAEINSAQKGVEKVINVTESFDYTAVLTVNGGKQITLTSSNDVSLRMTGTARHVNVTGAGTTLTIGKGITLDGVDNTATGGGVNIASDGTFVLDGGTITNCRATNGGGVYRSGGTFEMKDGIISNNIATSYGGGVHLGTNGTFTMEGGTISDNIATNGGGVYLNSGTVTMTDGKIFNNTASFGGGMYILGTFTMENGELSNNTATSNGGGVLVTGTFTMKDGKITNNTATSNGGGVSIGASANAIFTMTGGEITNNIATNGGGVYHTYGVFTMDGGTITNNTATSNGGGVYVKIIISTYTPTTTLIMDGGEIANNTATNGGGIYRDSGTITVTRGTISGNTAVTNGGGIYTGTAWSSKVTTSATTIFRDNLADRLFVFVGDIATYPNIQWESISAGENPLNNYDVYANGLTYETNPRIEVTQDITTWTNQNVTLTIHALDTISGIKHITLPNNEVVEGDTATFVVTENGTFTFSTENTIGDAKSISYKVSNIDKELPNISYGTNGNNAYKQSHATIMRVSDTLSGVDTVQYGWSTSSTEEPASWTNTSNNATLTTPLGITGAYYLWGKGTDKAGNTLITTSNGFHLDNTVPTIEVRQDDTEMTDGNVHLTVKGTDAHSGVAHITLPDGTMVAEDTASYEAMKNGTYTFTVTDKAGNVETTTHTVSNINSSPEIEVMYDTAWTNKNVVLNIHATDFFGIDRIILPDGTVVNSDSVTYVVGNNGLYGVVAFNSLDNFAIEAVEVRNIDRIKPNITSSQRAKENGTVEVSVDATDS